MTRRGPLQVAWEDELVQRVAFVVEMKVMCEVKVKVMFMMILSPPDLGKRLLSSSVSLRSFRDGLDQHVSRFCRGAGGASSGRVGDHVCRV